MHRSGEKEYLRQAIIKVQPPSRTEIRTIRLLIICGLCAMIGFCLWFTDPEHMGHSLIFWLLTFALVFKLVKMLHEWYHYWSPSVPTAPPLPGDLRVDVLTTACPGEPKEMIIRILRAMKAIRYPHTSYLCDEGNDPELKKRCEELGVIHVYREKKTDAKAGNINNALKTATGEICVILDPDHEPVPEFLDRTLPYFADERVGFVQCIQAYSNQKESFIAKGAAEQTYHFYGPMMMTMNTYGTVQAIGANCSFRRAALDSIGGHAPGLAEDMHTAMQLHAKGWKSVYIPEILTRGLVPATLSSYYKQQLKWSRGTFELLFRTFPNLASKFTWRQKLHYFTIPMYFLMGLINGLDLSIPIAAMLLANVPWEMNLAQFAFMFLPVCCLSIMIRFYAQRWLAEEHERGFHFAGGILRTATWWIFLVGFIYAIFKIKVPYIPTPKEDEHQNFIRLSLPNLLMAMVCAVAVYYGLKLDWTPYSMAMAFYVLLNMSMLLFVAAMSQQRTLRSMEQIIERNTWMKGTRDFIQRIGEKLQERTYGLLRNGPATLIIGVSLIFMSYNISVDAPGPAIIKEKTMGGFFLGLHGSPEMEQPVQMRSESLLSRDFDVISLDVRWEEKTAALKKKLDRIAANGRISLINWIPPVKEEGTARLILEGNYDAYLKECVSLFREHRYPILICFAPGFDDPAYSWSAEKDRGEMFRKTWQHLYSFFNNYGISNLTWVWNPKGAEAHDYYPGTKFIDWIGMTGVQEEQGYGTAAFASRYAPFRESYGPYQKPVIINGLGHTGKDNTQWMRDALESIDDFGEIRGLILHEEILQGKQEQTIQLLADRLSATPFNEIPFPVKEIPVNDKKAYAYTSPFISGKPGSKQLVLQGKPFYIKGIAYNPEHDWRDGHMPLTRRQLEKDFSLIRKMGANCIRRYDHGIYDKNILNVASEFDLKVLYGFWFDPEIDYYKDSVKVKKYLEEVEEKVMELKDHPAIMGWSVGNETWGLLKHRYSKPYLTMVRHQYVRMVEKMAQKIHAIDPGRPVFSSIEHETYQLPGELVAFHDGAPSLDVIGINSYYRQQIGVLNHVCYQFDSLRPYLVSEFGPNGYWDPYYNKFSKGCVIEDTENEKAGWYKEQWERYVKGYAGYNVGGFAYCWHDRMEGSYTWFGLTDYKGRLKPSYYALKELWTDQKEKVLPQFRIIAPALIEPGKKYLFTAVSSGQQPPDLLFEWKLMKGNFLESLEAYSSQDRRWAILSIPKEASDYRIYLYVSDQKGNVTTASVPVKVR